MHSTFPPALELSVGNPPLVPFLSSWKALLSYHHDVHFVRYNLTGLSEGFQVEFSWIGSFRSAHRNIPSAYQHPEVVDEYISNELAMGNLIGPFSSPLLSSGQSLHVNRIGVVPEGHNRGKWHLINDLSFPEGKSINDGVNSDWCSLEYTSVDKVAMEALASGRGALLAKKM